MVNGIKKLKPRLIRLLLVAVACVIVVMVLVAMARPKAVEVDDYTSCVQAGGAVNTSSPETCTHNGKSFTRTMQDRSTTDMYTGLDENQALAKAREAGKPARVVERDGEALPVTMDFSPGRLNLYVRDGVVYKVEVEGETTQ